jgi:hypothetical protein
VSRGSKSRNYATPCYHTQIGTRLMWSVQVCALCSSEDASFCFLADHFFPEQVGRSFPGMLNASAFPMPEYMACKKLEFSVGMFD